MTNGLSRSGFDVDLREGEAREDAFVYTFLKARVEHKCDMKCKTTGNIFIEYESFGKPSGIAVSTADYFAIEYDESSWLIIPTTKLKSFARLAYKEASRRVNGGDNDKSKGVLVPITWLIRPCTEVDTG